jgi:hypothetical protein
VTDTPPAAPPADPTPAQAQALGAAAAEGAHAAAQQGADPQAGAAAAVEQKADQLNLKISDEDKREIARLSAELHMQMMRDAGAFEPPPQRAPTTAATPAGAGETAGGGEPPAAPPADAGPAPKRTFAEWLRGGE